MTDESQWSTPHIIHIQFLPVPKGFFANFTNPRLIQEMPQGNFFLSVKISVHWQPLESASDITGYHVYIGYQELRPYDTLSSASTAERQGGPVTLVREQVVGADGGGVEWCI